MALRKITTVLRIALAALVAAAVAAVAFIQTRPPECCVAVDDEALCAALERRAEQLGEAETYIPRGQIASLERRFWEKPPVVAAYITTAERSGLGGAGAEASARGGKGYYISSRFLVPTIECDFAVPESDQAKITEPALSVSISSVEEMPEKSRALLLEGKYLGDEGYKLEIKRYAECSFFCAEETKSRIEKFLDENFALAAQEMLAADAASANDAGGTSGIGGAHVPPTAATNVPPKPVFVAAVGDIMLARGVEEILASGDDGIKSVFTDTLPILQGSDVTIGNLEGAVTDCARRREKTYTFKFGKAVLPALRRAGFTYLVQTNNHCYDYGEEGFKDTLAALKEAGLASSGIGENLAEAGKFHHAEIGGQRFALISCGAYPPERSGFDGKADAGATEKRAGILWQSDALLENVKAERAAGNIVLVNVHGGEEYNPNPSADQRKFYEALVDSGASAVFGSHPHVLQSPEWHNGGLIVYSLGNFVFPGMEEMPAATESEIVRLGFVNGKIVYAERYPCAIDGKAVGRK